MQAIIRDGLLTKNESITPVIVKISHRTRKIARTAI